MWMNIIIFIIILVILSGLFIGNYFFNITLNRSNTWFKTSGGEQVNTPSKTPLAMKADKTMQDQYSIAQKFWDKYTIKTPTITSFDGLRLFGRVIKANPKSKKWAICMHGYRSTAFADVSYPVVKLSEMGFNALVPDQRSHGESEGKYIGMGWNERLDLIQWIEYLLKEEPEAEILLYGGSMGAATVMNTSGETLPKQVKAIIADCGYTSVPDEFAYILNNAMGLPREPFIFLANIITNIRARYSLYEVSCIKQLKKNKRPILFIHGTSDTFIPCSMTARNAAATNGKKEVLYIDNATHFTSYVYDAKKYFATVKTFLNKNFSLK